MSTNKSLKGHIKSVALAIVETKQLAGGEFRITGWASKPTVDRHREVVETRAFKDTIDIFRRNPIMLYMHNAREPIGKWDVLDLRDEGLWVSGVLAKGYDVADKARLQIEQDIIKSLSIGFRDLESGPSDADGFWHYVKVELLEISPVAIPACREAVFTVSSSGKLLAIEELPELSEAEILARCRERGIEVVTPAEMQAAAADPEAATAETPPAAEPEAVEATPVEESTPGKSLGTVQVDLSGNEEFRALVSQLGDAATIVRDGMVELKALREENSALRQQVTELAATQERINDRMRLLTQSMIDLTVQAACTLAAQRGVTAAQPPTGKPAELSQ